MKYSVRHIAVSLIYFPIGALTVVAQGEIGRGFPYGNDGGWSGLLNVILVGVGLYLVIAIFWILWEILRTLGSWITRLLK